MREADKERNAKRRAAMTKEEKSAVKEEDRLRKAMKKTSQVDGRTLPRLLAQEKGRLSGQFMMRQQYKRRVKASSSEEEIQKIQNLLIQRNSRAKTNTKRNEVQKAKANEGMKLIREEGIVMKVKVRWTKGDGGNTANSKDVGGKRVEVELSYI